MLGSTTRWLVTSREFTNLTFHLTPLNLEHLAWFVADIAGCDVTLARAYIEEIQSDEEFKQALTAARRRSGSKWTSDRAIRLHKRLGWYAIVRILRPDVVVETGTDKGLGAMTLAAGVRRNGHGRVVTIDVNPRSGFLVSGPYADFVDRLTGDSIEILRDFSSPIDLLIHDSLHTYEHERGEFESATPQLSERAVVLSDNSHVTPALSDWAEVHGWKFTYYQEVPQHHWYAGAGIGAAVRGSVR